MIGIAAAVFVLVLLGGIAALVLAPGEDGPDGTGAASTPTTAPAAATGTADPAPWVATADLPGLRTPVRDDVFEFVVTGVERIGDTVGFGDSDQRAERGGYVVVRLTVTNLTDTHRITPAAGHVVYADTGRPFTATLALSLPGGETVDHSRTLGPGTTATGVPVLFDVHPDTVLERIELTTGSAAQGLHVRLTP